MKRKRKKVNKEKAKKVEVPQVKRGRGRPRKIKPLAEEFTLPVKKKRGRPPKIKTPLPEPEVKKDKLAAFRKPVKEVKAKKAKDTDVNIPSDKNIANHPLCAAAVWLLNNLPPHEETYIKTMARKAGTTPLYMTMEHILGYFQVKGSDIGQTLKEQHKPV